MKPQQQAGRDASQIALASGDGFDELRVPDGAGAAPRGLWWIL